MRFFRRLLSFSVLLALPAFAQKPAATPAAPMKGVTSLPDVVIGTGGGRPLHAVIAYPTVLPKDPMPAVIFIHGGGWVHGSYKGNGAKSLAQHGYFTASIEYRLSSEAIWPAQIEDCKLAVRWLRANAAKYHVDPDRIGVWGFSAGGHLVVCLGTMNDPKWEGTDGYPACSSKVQAVVDLSGPVDFTTGSEGLQKKAAQPPDYDAPVLVGLFGGSFKAKAALWKEGSPLSYVAPGDPPFLILQGDHDQTVAPAQAVMLDAALKKAGVPDQLIMIKNGGHGFSVAPGQTAVPNEATLNADILAFFDKYLKPASAAKN